jgi:phosphoheptose isomerase
MSSEFLYPMIDGGQSDASELLADLARSAGEKARASAELTAATLADRDAQLDEIATAMAERFRAGGRLFTFGNGGSAADAQHLAAELVGRLDAGRERSPLAGLALTTDTSALTAVSNDFGFDQVFARQVAAHGRPGDVLVCISTSGRSKNVIRAAEAARELGMPVIALLGPGSTSLDELADVSLHVPGETSGQIQQGHAIVGHLLCELAEAGAGA